MLIQQPHLSTQHPTRKSQVRARARTINNTAKWSVPPNSSQQTYIIFSFSKTIYYLIPPSPRNTSVCVEKFVLATLIGPPPPPRRFHGSNFWGIWGIFVNMKWKKYFACTSNLDFIEGLLRLNFLCWWVGKKITSYVVLKTERAALRMCVGNMAAVETLLIIATQLLYAINILIPTITLHASIPCIIDKHTLCS